MVVVAAPEALHGGLTQLQQRGVPPLQSLKDQAAPSLIITDNVKQDGLAEGSGGSTIACDITSYTLLRWKDHQIKSRLPEGPEVTLGVSDIPRSALLNAASYSLTQYLIEGSEFSPKRPTPLVFFGASRGKDQPPSFPS